MTRIGRSGQAAMAEFIPVTTITTAHKVSAIRYFMLTPDQTSRKSLVENGLQVAAALAWRNPLG
jgi:hypothetical protein